MSIYKVWLNEIVALVESNNKVSYAAERNRIFSDDLKLWKTVSDIGRILDERAAVCLELSFFGAALFAEYGIKTAVVGGHLKESNRYLIRSGNRNGHVWIQVIDESGQHLEVVDSNLTRKVHPDVIDYYSDVGSAEIIIKQFID